MDETSNTRIFWIVWCCFWALAWMFAGFFLFFIGGFILWLGVPASLLCILAPVGKRREIGPSAYQTHPHPPIQHRPAVPSSRFDKRFTEDELRNYWGQ